MKKPKAKILFLLLVYLNAINAQLANAAVDSTMVTPPAAIDRKLCYTLVIDGITVSGTTQYIASALNVASMCSVVGTGGGMGLASAVMPIWMAGGGNLQLYCPPDYPYVKSYTEGWGYAFLFWFLVPFYGGGAGTGNIMCCKAPMHVTSMTSSWETPDVNGKCASGI